MRNGQASRLRMCDHMHIYHSYLNSSTLSFQSTYLQKSILSLTQGYLSLQPPFFSPLSTTLQMRPVFHLPFAIVFCRVMQRFGRLPERSMIFIVRVTGLAEDHMPEMFKVVAVVPPKRTVGAGVEGVFEKALPGVGREKLV